MGATHIFSADNYTIPVTHIVSSFIREYDIAKANISILLSKGLISREQYTKLFYADKHTREVTVGLMQRKDPALSKSLMDGFGEARTMFYEANDIKDYEILSVKKDAIFLINKIPKYTKFGNIEFKNKNEYTSFYKINNLELYYYYMNGVESIDIKGMSDISLSLHKDYMLDILLYIFGSAQSEKSIDVLKTIKAISNQYSNRELDINYFREFNNRSLFRTYCKYNGNIAFLESISKDTRIDAIDPSFNYSILSYLFKIFSDTYL